MESLKLRSVEQGLNYILTKLLIKVIFSFKIFSYDPFNGSFNQQNPFIDWQLHLGIILS